MSEKLKVGQTLWYVPTDRAGARGWYVTIDKVGKKWAYSDKLGRGDLRIDINTLCVFSTYEFAAGKCHLSKEGYESHLEINNEWISLFRLVSKQYSTPKGISAEDIRQARRLLGFGES